MKYFFECGGCDCYHPLGFTGDCRDDENRFNFDDEGNLVNPFGHGYRESTLEIVPEDFQVGDEKPIEKRYRVAWRSRQTEYTGHGEWFQDRTLVSAWVKEGNKDGAIDHWLEEEQA